MANTNQNTGAGTWTYRSFMNNPDITATFNSLEFGVGTLMIMTASDGTITGTIGGAGWELELAGTVKEGTPSVLEFQGKGMVSGSPWVYNYLCYVVPTIAIGVNQVPALVGTVTRALSHPSGTGFTNPAGDVASFYAVLQ